MRAPAGALHGRPGGALRRPHPQPPRQSVPRERGRHRPRRLRAAGRPLAAQPHPSEPGPCVPYRRVARRRILDPPARPDRRQSGRTLVRAQVLETVPPAGFAARGTGPGRSSGSAGRRLLLRCRARRAVRPRPVRAPAGAGGRRLRTARGGGPAVHLPGMERGRRPLGGGIPELPGGRRPSFGPRDPRRTAHAGGKWGRPHLDSAHAQRDGVRRQHPQQHPERRPRSSHAARTGAGARHRARHVPVLR